jgi:hypothetical protein
MSSTALPLLRVTEIGEYIRHHSCERRFRLEIDHRKLARKLPFSERLFNVLDPVLQEAGRERETEWETSLASAGYRTLGETESPTTEAAESVSEAPPTPGTAWETFAAAAQALSSDEGGYGREVRVRARLGAFELEGRIDFVLVLWRDGNPRLRLVECKASRRDRTYQRVQVAVYRLLVRALLEAQPLTIGGYAIDPADIECVVARIDETTNESQQILALEPLDLAMEEADVVRLLADDGALLRIARSDLDDLAFELNQKCDGCVFNVHCFAESGRQRRLELLSIPSSSARTLRAAGIATIDDLATLDLDSDAARRVREDIGFPDNLAHLKVRAAARRTTLLGGDADPDTYEVTALKNTGDGQLPLHEIDGHRLVRVYLAVDYDYAENRIGALSAHVTTSDGQFHTTFVQDATGRWAPDPAPRERIRTGTDANNRPVFSERAVRGNDIAEFVTSEWTGKYDLDTGTEKQLIQSFFRKLVDAIAEAAGQDQAPIHFYVWSRAEMARLVEACSRVSSKLLSHLRELLGCRESLEQLLYSCLQDEVDHRYALGWTGRGLSVVSSLRWFGRTFHWRRNVAGRLVDLDHAFTQDLFDFKTELDLRADGTWAAKPAEAATHHKFEIRSRFFDTLTAPYWRAYWGTLPNPDAAGLNPKVANSIRRYNEAAKPRHLDAYLTERTHALRWIEESVQFKNAEITKPLVTIAALPAFDLGVEDAAHASIDFLRLDQHVKVTDWIAAHLLPPVHRVPRGRTIPVSDVVSHGNNRLSATITLDGYDMDMAALRARATIAEGAFVRLTPCADDPQRGQTFKQLTRGGKTCKVTSIDWDTGQVTLDALWTPSPTQYLLLSAGEQEERDVFLHATIDESVSDFVADKVETRLRGTLGASKFQWFDPETPTVPAIAPLPTGERDRCEAMLKSLALPGGKLADDQVAAILDGLETRVHLLQGPPGTGKTTTTAVAILTRIIARRSVGDVVLAAAHTHQAVDTLLRRLDAVADAVAQHATARGFTVPPVRLVKVNSSGIDEPIGGNILDIVSKPSIQVVNRERKDAVLVIGGTTSAVLKLAAALGEGKPFKDQPERFQSPVLIVDEASMMVFPHFLALATLVTEDGEILLAGDHRQLAPIVAHDWEREDRPPAVLYQPFVSAYQAVQNISEKMNVVPAAVRRSALSFTFRLPPLIRELIARLYRLDDIALDGLERGVAAPPTTQGSWEQVWQGDTGLFLVLHSERQSRQSNETEAAIIEGLLTAAPTLPKASTAVMTPHRAQRSLLKTRLAGYAAPVDVIDTVERLQGGERKNVIVSATASDPSSIAASVEFILDLNRSNVAFSRAQDRLIVVCSDSLLDHIPAETEHYESAMLWKALRTLCSVQVGSGTVHGHYVRILTPPVPSRTT